MLRLPPRPRWCTPAQITPAAEQTANVVPGPDAAARGLECAVCLGDEGAMWVCPADPGHVVCRECTGHHIAARMDQGMTLMTCPAGYAECGYTLTKGDVFGCAGAETAAALEQAIANGGDAAETSGGPRASPVDAVKRWLWAARHTKKCPRCNARIQKNGGCNHMTCRCGHEFCWVCRADWRTHKNGRTQYHTSGVFPDLEDFREGTVCHSQKIWAYRIVGGALMVGIGVPLVVGGLAGYAVLVGTKAALYDMPKSAADTAARRREASAARAARESRRERRQLDDDWRHRREQAAAEWRPSTALEAPPAWIASGPICGHGGCYYPRNQTRCMFCAMTRGESAAFYRHMRFVSSQHGRLGADAGAESWAEAPLRQRRASDSSADSLRAVGDLFGNLSDADESDSDDANAPELAVLRLRGRRGSAASDRTGSAARADFRPHRAMSSPARLAPEGGTAGP